MNKNKTGGKPNFTVFLFLVLIILIFNFRVTNFALAGEEIPSAFSPAPNQIDKETKAAADAGLYNDGLDKHNGKKGENKDRKDRRNGGRGHGKRGNENYLPMPEGVWPVASVIIARPGATTIDVNVLAAKNIRGHIEYLQAGKSGALKTADLEFAAGEPKVVRLNGLQSNTAYRYRLIYAEPGRKEMTPGPEYAFHTQRAQGSAFIFEIQGDSHPERDKQNDPTLYAQTLRAASKDGPDFYMTIGDDFSVDRMSRDEISAAAVDKIYLGQRHYLGLVAHSAPLFLVNGNHEQAARTNLDGTAGSVAVMAQNSREKYFSQPAPEGIFTGDGESVEHIGLLRDYYAWNWGDALFVVIDPYWHSQMPVDNIFGEKKGEGKSEGKGKRDLWNVTLGDAQYNWLKNTLAKSTAKYKFVFAHHVLGTGRGGVEQAGLYEWGGKNKRGGDEFAGKRPGWELPVHELMVKYGVTIFFQGHDHIFCKQSLDGIVYQSLPEPADASYTLYNKESYVSGDALPNSGRVRVKVSPEKVLVEYVRSYLSKDATPDHPDGEVAYSYTVAPRNGQAKK